MQIVYRGEGLVSVPGLGLFEPGVPREVSEDVAEFMVGGALFARVEAVEAAPAPVVTPPEEVLAAAAAPVVPSTSATALGEFTLPETPAEGAI